MNVYLLFSVHVQALFVIIRVCGINLKANNFHWIEYENNSLELSPFIELPKFDGEFCILFY